jgi:hypothetical protein
MDLLKVLSELSPGAKIILTLISAPFAVWLTWLKVKKGAVSLSQARTKRLYELMLLKDVSEVPSAALVMAVKEAFNVELDGDKIRFAWQYDNPLMVLRAFKTTLGIVKMSLDGRTCEDARTNPWWSFEVKKSRCMRLMFIIYGLLVASAIVSTIFLHESNSRWVGYAFLFNFATLPLLMWQMLKADTARKLVDPKPGELRRPASSLIGESQPVLDSGVPSVVSKPSELFAETKASEVEEDHDEVDDATKEVIEVIEKVIDAAKEDSEKLSGEDAAPTA